MSSLLVEVGGPKAGRHFKGHRRGDSDGGGGGWWMRAARRTESVSFLLRQTLCLCLAQEVAPSRCFLSIIIE